MRYVFAVVEGVGDYTIHAIFDDEETAKGHAHSLNQFWYPPNKNRADSSPGSSGHVKVLRFELNKYFAWSPVKEDAV